MSGRAEPVNWLSPSAVARMQACGLAEARRRASPPGARPSSAGARLGSAAHRVLEWVAREAPELAGGGRTEILIAERWAHEVAVEVGSAANNPVEPAHGPLERWPGYARITAGLKVDGRELAAELADLPAERRLPEHAMRSRDGRIHGTADLIVLDESGEAHVIDHKAGAVDQEDTASGGRYDQQVVLYAALARDQALHPSSAEIRPLGRARLPVHLSDERMDRVVAEAHRQIERFNEAVAAGQEIDLASPSEASCGWCPYIVDCAAIWDGELPDLGRLTCFEGEVTSLQVLQSSVALSIRSESADVVIVGAPQRDARGRKVQPGGRVRATGLRPSSSGRLQAGAQSLLLVLD